MQVEELSRFYQQSLEDPRISATHISLYMALFECWNRNSFCNPVRITRHDLMPLAKINGIATYHRCIKDLHEIGYIIYRPSFDPRIPSEVVLL